MHRNFCIVYGRRMSTVSEELFTRIYKEHAWGGESLSGTGSDLPITAQLRVRLAFLIKMLGIKTLCDVPCGDFHWMKEVDLSGVDYLGADIVPAMIEKNQKDYGSAARKFIHLDVVKESPPPVDLIFCKDLFLHLSLAEVRTVLGNFKKSGATYLLANSLLLPVFPTKQGLIRMNLKGINADFPDLADPEARMYGRNVSLLDPPFSLPEPLLVLLWNEVGVHFCLWRLADLNL